MRKYGSCIPKRGPNFEPSVLKQPKCQKYVRRSLVLLINQTQLLAKNNFGHTNQASKRHETEMRLNEYLFSRRQTISRTFLGTIFWTILEICFEF